MFRNELRQILNLKNVHEDENYIFFSERTPMALCEIVFYKKEPKIDMILGSSLFQFNYEQISMIRDYMRLLIVNNEKDK